MNFNQKNFNEQNGEDKLQENERQLPRPSRLACHDALKVAEPSRKTSSRQENSTKEWRLKTRSVQETILIGTEEDDSIDTIATYYGQDRTVIHAVGNSNPHVIYP